MVMPMTTNPAGLICTVFVTAFRGGVQSPVGFMRSSVEECERPFYELGRQDGCDDRVISAQQED